MHPDAGAHGLSVIVVGGGPSGLAAAIALRRAGASVTVCERAERPRRDGQGLTLWPNGLAALDAIGAGDAVRARGLFADGMAMRSWSGRVLSLLPSPVMELVGGNGLALHRAELVEALVSAAGAVTYGTRCVGVRNEPGCAVAVFADGSEQDADLVVGADGLRSAVRLAAGLGGALSPAGCTVWRATIPFVLPPCPGTLSFGGHAQFGLWRLPGDRVYWFASGAADMAVFTDWHAPIPDLVAATSAEEIKATDIYDCRPLRAWSRGRVVLVGDAAHPSMPHMGQGTSQAFEDAAVLAACLGTKRDVGVALAAYEASRRRRARAAWSQARMLARLGEWRSPAACWLRERMLSAVPSSVQLAQLRHLFRWTLA